MRDPDLVFKAQLAAAALERAWHRWRVLHGLAADPMPTVSSYVGYSLEEPWGQPRVVFGLAAEDAEQLAALLERHDCIGPVYATVAALSDSREAPARAGSRFGLPLPVPPQAPSVAAEQQAQPQRPASRSGSAAGPGPASLSGARPAARERPAPESALDLGVPSPAAADDADGPVFRQAAAAMRKAAAGGQDVGPSPIHEALARATAARAAQVSDAAVETKLSDTEAGQEQLDDTDADQGKAADTGGAGQGRVSDAVDDEASDNGTGKGQVSDAGFSSAGAAFDTASPTESHATESAACAETALPADRSGAGDAEVESGGGIADDGQLAEGDRSDQDVPGLEPEPGTGHQVPTASAVGFEVPEHSLPDRDRLADDDYAAAPDQGGNHVDFGTPDNAHFSAPWAEFSAYVEFGPIGDSPESRQVRVAGDAIQQSQGSLAVAAAAARAEAEARIREAAQGRRGSARHEYPYSGETFDITEVSRLVAQEPAAAAGGPGVHRARPRREAAAGAYREPAGAPDSWHAADQANVASAWGGPEFDTDESAVPFGPGDDMAAYLDASSEPDKPADGRQETPTASFIRRSRMTRGYPIPRLSRAKRPGAVPGA